MANPPESMMGRLKELLAGRMARTIDRYVMEWMHGPEHPIVRAHRQVSEGYRRATRIDEDIMRGVREAPDDPLVVYLHERVCHEIRRLLEDGQGGPFAFTYALSHHELVMRNSPPTTLHESFRRLMRLEPAPGFAYRRISLQPQTPGDTFVLRLTVDSVRADEVPAHVHTSRGVWPPQTSIWHGYQDLTGGGWGGSSKPRYHDPGVPTTACSWCPTVFPAADAYKSTESGALICPACFARGEQAGRAKLKQEEE